MVGVPGRSQACLTCLRRKKGCDYERPACGPCRRASVPCAGYERQRVFVVNTDNGGPSVGSMADDTGSSPSSMSWQISHRRYNRGDVPEAELPEFLARSAYEEKYLGMYWDVLLPHGKPFPDESMLYSTGAVWNIMLKDYRDCAVLRTAILANCLCTIGRRDGETWMVAEGVKAYGRALRGMTAQLRQPAQSKKVSLLVASRLLNQFEIFFAADREDGLGQAQGWLGHTAGERALLAARKAEAHIRGDAHAVLCDGRLNLCIGDIMLRRRQMLSQREWKTVPWLEVPKTPKDELIDIMVELPGLLEDVDDMRQLASGATKSRSREALVIRCWELDSELQAWVGRSAPAVNVDELLESGLDRIPTTELSKVHILQLYSTVCVLLYSTLRQLSERAQDQLPARMDVRTHVIQIVRTMPIMLSHSAARWGMSTAAFPMGVALQTMLAVEPVEEKSEERLALLKLFNGPRGKEIGGFLDSLLRSTTRSRPQLMMQEGNEARKARAEHWSAGGDKQLSAPREVIG